MTPSPAVLFGIPALAVVVALAFVTAQYVATGSRSTAFTWLLGVAGWFALTGAVAASGWLGRTDVVPPPMALMIAVAFGLGLSLGFGRSGERLAQTLPLWALIGGQSFRLPLELVMHQAAREGVMPHEMSFSGYNFDIVTGASAVVVAALVARGKAPRLLVVVWNAYGILCLCVIAVVAMLSSPMLRAFGDDPAHINRWVTQFPFVWLPTVLVVAAVAGHVIVARRLLAEARERRAP